MPTSRFALALVAGCIALACASAPRIETEIGEGREFPAGDRYAPADLEVLATENPVLDDLQLEELHAMLEGALGWRGLPLAKREDADWLVSCAFRKRLIWRGELGVESFSEPWQPERARVMGPRGQQYGTRGTTNAYGQKAPETWVETLVELRVRSRRTGTIGWSAARIWGRNRTELGEGELGDTLAVLLGEMRVAGTPPPDAGGTPPPDAGGTPPPVAAPR